MGDFQDFLSDTNQYGLYDGPLAGLRNRVKDMLVLGGGDDELFTLRALFRICVKIGDRFYLFPCALVVHESSPWFFQR